MNKYEQLYSTDNFNKYNYTGNDLGVTYTKEYSIFKLWAPLAKEVILLLYNNPEASESDCMIHMTLADNVYEVKVYGDLCGKYYNYLIKHDNSTGKVVDPYAKAVCVNGKKAAIINMADTNSSSFLKDSYIKLINPCDAVIYETHIRDFSADASSHIKNKCQYNAFLEEGTVNNHGQSTGISHLTELGVTHIHLLPLAENASVDEHLGERTYNFGYDPLNYNVPEGSYSSDPYEPCVRITELKNMVSALHKKGLGVIMDVVYNHTYSVDNFQKIMPYYYYRSLNGTFIDGSACGNETASDRFMMRKFMIDSLCYLAEEYHIDGFRFDLMAIHDIDTMNAIEQRLRKINPSVILYGEGWIGGKSLLDKHLAAYKCNASKLKNIAVFSDDIRDGIKGCIFEKSSTGYVHGDLSHMEDIKFGIVGSTRHPQVNIKNVHYSDNFYAKSPAQVVNYCACHDDMTLYDNLSLSSASSEDIISMYMLSYAIVFLSQGIPFIPGGEEFVRSKDGCDNSYKSSDKINSIKWDNKYIYNSVYEYIRGLIKIKKKFNALRLSSATDVYKRIRFIKSDYEEIIMYSIDSSDIDSEYKKLTIIFNPGKSKVIDIPVGSHIFIHNDIASDAPISIADTDEITINAISCLMYAQPK